MDINVQGHKVCEEANSFKKQCEGHWPGLCQGKPPAKGAGPPQDLNRQQEGFRGEEGIVPGKGRGWWEPGGEAGPLEEGGGPGAETLVLGGGGKHWGGGTGPAGQMQASRGKV